MPNKLEEEDTRGPLVSPKVSSSTLRGVSDFPADLFSDGDGTNSTAPSQSPRGSEAWTSTEYAKAVPKTPVTISYPTLYWWGFCQHFTRTERFDIGRLEWRVKSPKSQVRTTAYPLTSPPYGWQPVPWKPAPTITPHPPSLLLFTFPSCSSFSPPPRPSSPTNSVPPTSFVPCLSCFKEVL